MDHPVFETFRDMAMNTYHLDPAQYYSLPGYSWDAMLRFTKVKIELITDPDMYQMVELGIRGGICQIRKRFSEANHPKMDNLDPSKPTKILIYQDANALYAWAMMNSLPLRNFTWASNTVDYSSVGEDSSYCYILEVDLSYPKHLHNSQSDYPLAVEHLDITNDMLSPYQRKYFPEQKLVPNLNDKKRYVVHYQNLQVI